jgi:hypothetical protein
MSNPIEEFLEMSKGADAAAIGRAAKEALPGIGRSLGHGALFGAASLGVAGLGLAAGKIYEAATKGRDFRSMMEGNPDLAQAHESNPKAFNQMYSSLRTMNPEFSREPMVAGTYMRRMIESEPETRGMVAVEALSERPQAPRPGPGMGAALEGFGRGMTSPLARPPEQQQIGKETTEEVKGVRRPAKRERTIYGQPGQDPFAEG